jgi:hypothetical protein
LLCCDVVDGDVLASEPVEDHSRGVGAVRCDERSYVCDG